MKYLFCLIITGCFCFGGKIYIFYILMSSSLSILILNYLFRSSSTTHTLSLLLSFNYKDKKEISFKPNYIKCDSNLRYTFLTILEERSVWFVYFVLIKRKKADLTAHLNCRGRVFTRNRIQYNRVFIDLRWISDKRTPESFRKGKSITDQICKLKQRLTTNSKNIKYPQLCYDSVDRR